MDDNYSQRFNVSLGELEEEYARLLAETASRDNLSQQSGKKGSDNLRWTRVVSREHFQIAGMRDFLLSDDIAEVWEEINDAAIAVGQDWQPLFNPKDWEAKDVSQDSEEYRLSDKELEELAEKVV